MTDIKETKSDTESEEEMVLQLELMGYEVEEDYEEGDCPEDVLD